MEENKKTIKNCVFLAGVKNLAKNTGTKKSFSWDERRNNTGVDTTRKHENTFIEGNKNYFIHVSNADMLLEPQKYLRALK